MRRCTEKSEIPNFYSGSHYFKGFKVDDRDIMDKLGMLEDLEEELGCPLDVYWKLHNKAHIYDEFGTTLKILKVLADTVAVRPIEFKEGHCFFPLADYKKTWWLKKDKSE